jgi:hypothetical protein
VPVTVLSTIAGLQLPVIASNDVVGNTGAGDPAQIAVNAVNVGVTLPAFTVCTIVVVVAHWPAVGVNVYVPVTVLSTIAGLQVPVIASNDVVGNTGAVPPTQIAGNAVNVGVVGIVIVCIIVVVKAHWPAVGVNVYVPVTVLSTIAGLQVPVIASNDVVGNTGAGDPAQIAVNAVNVGVTFGVTVCTIVVVKAHWPAVGVNVYVPVTVLSTIAGLQVPVITFVDVVGNTGAAAPLHIAVNAVNVGVTFGVTVCTIVVVKAHWPAAGVNV